MITVSLPNFTLSLLIKKFMMHRKLPDDAWARVMAETLLPGVTEIQVARRHGLAFNNGSSLRTLARQGRLLLPAPEDPTEFAALLVGPVEDRSFTLNNLQAIVLM